MLLILFLITAVCVELENSLNKVRIVQPDCDNLALTTQHSPKVNHAAREFYLWTSNICSQLDDVTRPIDKLYKGQKSSSFQRLKSSLTFKGSLASMWPSAHFADAESNLTLNCNDSNSGAPGRDLTLSPRSTENPVSCRALRWVLNDTGQCPIFLSVTTLEVTRP